MYILYTIYVCNWLLLWNGCLWQPYYFTISYTSQDDIVYKISNYDIQPIRNYGLFCLMLNFQYNEIIPIYKNYNSSNNNSQILSAYK